MRAPLHVLVVLLCSAYRACSCSFEGSSPHSPLYYYIIYIVLITIYSVSFATVQCDWGWGRVFLAGGARRLVASQAGSSVFWLFGFGVSSSNPPFSRGTQPPYATKALIAAQNRSSKVLSSAGLYFSISSAILFSKQHFFRTENQNSVLLTVFGLKELFFQILY